MSDIETTTVCEEGFACTSQIDDFDLQVDATGETGPTATSTLVATYASCYLPAFRVGGRQRGEEDLGQLQIDADAEVDEDDDLTSIAFDLYVEADVDDETLDEIAERGKDICHVHDALKSELEADITVHGDAF